MANVPKPGEDRDALSLSEITAIARRAVRDGRQVARQADGLQTIAFFDLTESSHRKLSDGNTEGSIAALTFTALASEIASLSGGIVVKTLGDGALISFGDPIAACEAALNLRYASTEIDLEMTAGITSGRPIRIDLGGDRFDLLGDVVDRAARIQSLAVPGQVLIDESLYSQIRADLVDRAGWAVDAAPRRGYAKGIGDINLYELCLPDQWGLKQQLATPYRIITNGRPALSEKLALVKFAHTEIVEIGIGLTSFANYFEGQKPDEFRDPLRHLVRKGVNIKCFALDPTYAAGQAWLAEQGNPDYASEAVIARRRLEDESRFYRRQSYRGRLNYYTFARVPEFWCLGVDLDDPLDGRMFYASYLMGLPRSSNPVIQVSRLSNPELFEKLLRSVQVLREASTENR